MLVLSRSLGTSLKIGDDITVTVLGISGSQVRIGISAPTSVKILRDDAVCTEPKQPRKYWHD